MDSSLLQGKREATVLRSPRGRRTYENAGVLKVAFALLRRSQRSRGGKRSPVRRSSGVGASGEKSPSPRNARRLPQTRTVVNPRTENRTPFCQTPSVCAALLVEPHRSSFIDRRLVGPARKPVGFLPPPAPQHRWCGGNARFPRNERTCLTGPPSGIWHGLLNDACRAMKGTSAVRLRRKRWFRLEGGRYYLRVGKSRSECDEITDCFGCERAAWDR